MTRPRSTLRRLLRCSILVGWSVAAQAQGVAQQRLLMVEFPGQERDDFVRMRSLQHADSTIGYLIRSPSSRMPRAPRDGAVHLDFLVPDTRVQYNSQLPWSQNDGAFRGGRGIGSVTRLGFVLEAGPFRAIFAPEVLNEANLSFPIIPYSGARNLYAHPFHPTPESIDLPLRFGTEPRRTTVRGQSTVSLDLGPTVVGLTTENAWWGPGMRNALVLSSNAEGIPRLFVRARRPIVTRIGTFDGQWFLGRLSESSFFDSDSSNNTRAASAIAATFRPAGIPNTEIGFARLVMTPTVNGAISLGTAFNAFHSVGRPNTAPKHPGNYTAPDQVFSIFGRVVLPEEGFETWVEWARTEEPLSFRDLLEQPGHSQAYTLGAQLVRPLQDPNHRLRVRFEATYAEPSPSIRFQKGLLSSYTSTAVIQGFTQDGQMIGPAIGPAASSEFVGADYLRPLWNAGLFVGRIRYDNSMLFGPSIPPAKRSDIAAFYGLRGSVVYRGVRIAAEFQSTVRLNYLYQAYYTDIRLGTTDGVDFKNRTLSIAVSPNRGF